MSEEQELKLYRNSTDLTKFTGDIYGWDIETSGLHFKQDEIAVIQIYDESIEAVAVLHVRGKITRDILDFFEQPNKIYIGHNISMFDLLFLREVGLNPFRGQNWFDTLIAECIVTSNARSSTRRTLQATTQRRIGIKLKKESGGHTWMNPVLDKQQMQYAIEDVVYLPDIYREIVKKAEETGQLDVLNLEMENLLPVNQMTFNGMPVDEDTLKEFLIEQRNLAFDYKKKLIKYFKNPGINLNSSQQLIKGFAANGIYLNSTAAPILQELALGEDEDGPITTLLNYKHAAKADQMYGSKFLNQVVMGFIHPRFWQTGTDTGRASSSEPNCQQVPKSARKIFKAKKGWKIVSADFSQIEILTEGYYAEDQLIISAVDEGDVHSAICRQIFGYPADYLTLDSVLADLAFSVDNTNEITIEIANKELKQREVEFKAKRKLAKALVFTMLFGGGAARLYDYAHRSGSEITLAEAQDLVSKFFKVYQGLFRMRQWANREARIAQSRGYYLIRLPTGLRRIITGDKLRPTTILNTIVQGTAACGLKWAINLAHKANLSQYFIAMVHDELVAMVPEEIAESYALQLKGVMIDGMKMALDQNTPVKVEATIGDCWS